MKYITKEFEVDGINVFATAEYYPLWNSIENIDYDTDVEVDDETHELILSLCHDLMLNQTTELDFDYGYSK